MKKRLFIAVHYLEIGGVERSLIGLLNAIDYNRYDVDLFVYQHCGEFMSMIPPQVNLLPEIGSYAAIEKPMVRALREGHVDVVVGRLLAKWKFAKYKRKQHPKDGSAIFQYVGDCVTPLLPSLKKYGEYDVAISFLTPHNIVRDKVKAKMKLAWIHTDYTFIEVNAAQELPLWDAYDRIFTVSEGVKEGFVKIFPSLAKKVSVFENILSEKFICEQAMAGQEDIVKDGSMFRLLSVGRFTHAKNFDNVPFVCQKLVDKGLIFKWYLIGFGGDEDLIRKNIETTGMQNVCIILGKKTNPYPYMAACDVYVQPSRFEGKAVTVREAQILGKPVIIANYATAHSQVQDGVDGMIVPLDNNGMADGIAEFLRNNQKRQQITAYLQNHHYGNENEVKKLEIS